MERLPLLQVFILLCCYISAVAPNLIGCFKEDETNRQLTTNAGVYLSSSPIAYCVRQCNDNGYRYAGVQTTSCFCGQSLPMSNVSVDAECADKCPGTLETCGAENPPRYSVYDVSDSLNSGGLSIVMETDVELFTAVPITISINNSGPYSLAMSNAESVPWLTTNQTSLQRVVRQLGSVLIEALITDVYGQEATAIKNVAIKLRINGVFLICPEDVVVNQTFECVTTIRQGSDISVLIDMGGSTTATVQRLDSAPHRFGPASLLVTYSEEQHVDSSDGIRFLLNREIGYNGTLTGLEVDVKVPGNVTFLFYRGSCSSNTLKYCKHSRTCIDKAESCKSEQFHNNCVPPDLTFSLDSQDCINKSTGAVIKQTSKTSLPGNVLWNLQASITKLLSNTGVQFVVLTSAEQIHIQVGDVPAILKKTGMGEIKVVSSTQNQEFLMDSSKHVSNSGQPLSYSLIPSDVQQVLGNQEALLDLYIVRDVDVVTTHAYAHTGTGNYTVTVNASSTINHGTEMALVRVHDYIQDVLLNSSSLVGSFTPIVFMARAFDVPDAVFNYSLGDGYLNSNTTDDMFTHTFLQYGVFNWTVTAWNFANTITAWKTITVQDRLEDLRVYANPWPATILSQLTTIHIDYSQGSNLECVVNLGDSTIIQVDDNNSSFSNVTDHTIYFRRVINATLLTAPMETLTSTSVLECSKHCLTYPGHDFICTSFVYNETSGDCDLRNSTVECGKSCKHLQRSSGSDIYMLKDIHRSDIADYSSSVELTASSYQVGHNPGLATIDSGHVWKPLGSDASPFVQMKIKSVFAAVGIITQGDGTSSFVSSFTADSTINGIDWTPVENGKIFSGNIDSSTKSVIMLTEPILLRQIRILPQSFENGVSMRVGLKGLLVPTKTIEFQHEYKTVGVFHVNISCNNSLGSGVSATNAAVQAPIEGLTIHHSPIPVGVPSEVGLTTVSGSSIDIEASFAGAPIETTACNSDMPCSLVVKTLIHGNLLLQVTAANLVSDAHIVEEKVVADFLITNVDVIPDKLTVTSDSNLMFSVIPKTTVSRMNATVDFQDSFILDEHLEQLAANETAYINHTYTEAGVFGVKFEFKNSVSNLTKFVPVECQHPLQSMSVSNESPRPIVKDSPAIVVFTVSYNGSSLRIPSNVSAVVDFGDLSIETYKFTLFPFNFSHAFKVFGTFNVTINMTNQISSLLLEATAEVDEEIYNFHLKPSSKYVRVGELLSIDALVGFGSRYSVMWDVKDGTANRSAYVVEGNSSINHTYNQPNVYYVSAVASNQMNRMSTSLSDLDAIGVEHPVVGYKVIGSSTSLLPSDIPRVTNQTFSILIDSSSIEATNAIFSVDFDDGSIDAPAERLICNMSMSNEMGYRLCKDQLWHVYEKKGVYRISVTIENHVSKEVFNFTHQVYEEISNLRKMVFSKNTDTLENELGDGPEGQFYPLVDSVVFVANMTTGSDLTFCWDYGDSSPTECQYKTPTVLHKYDKPGTYVVTLNTSNPVDDSVIQKTIKIQREVKISEIKVETSTVRNVTHPFTIVLDQLGTEACYAIDFGDSMAVGGRYKYAGNWQECFRYWSSRRSDFSKADYLTVSTNTTFTISTIYTTLGSHDVNVKATNIVSMDEKTFKMGVTKGPCSFPIVSLKEPNRCVLPMCDNVNKKTVYRSVDFDVRSQVVINCSNTDTVHYQWKIERWSAGTWSGLGSDIEANITLYTTTSTKLAIGKLLLPVDLYRITLNTSMDDEIGIWSTDSVMLRIIQSPLQGSIDEGSYIQTKWGNNQTFKLMVLDPDIVNAIAGQDEVQWFCKKSCATWPIYNANMTIIANGSSANCSDDQLGKCFSQQTESGFLDDKMPEEMPQGEDLPWKILPNGTLLIDTSQMSEVSVHDIKVIAHRGGRVIEIETTLKITLGDPPKLKIKCFANCLSDILNPAGRLSVSGKIDSWRKNVRYVFRWDIFVITDGDKFDYQDPERFLLPHSKWIHVASTGASSMDLSLDGGLFDSIEWYRKQLKLRLQVYREGTPDNTGDGYYDFIVNDPPSAENVKCYANPPNGTALETLFNINCEGFTDVDVPISYAFGQKLQMKDSPSPFDNNNFPTLREAVQLPAGLQSENNDVYITVRATDRIGSSTEVVVKVKVLLPIMSTEEFAENLDNTLNDLNVQANPAKMTQAVMAMALIMNSEPEKTPEVDNTNVVVNEEEQKKQAEKEKQAQIEGRQKMLEAMADIEVKDVDTANQVLGAAIIVSAAGDQMSNKAQEKATKIAAAASSAIEEFAKDPNIGVEKLEQMASDTFSLLGNVRQAATTAADTQNAQVDSSVQTSAEKLTSEESAAKAQAQVRESNKVINGIVNTVFSKKVIGESATTLGSEFMSVSIQKQYPQHLSNATLSTDGGSSFTLPSWESLFDAGNETSLFIALQTKIEKQNPCTWTADALLITSPLVSLEFNDENDDNTNITGLSTEDEIELFLQEGNPSAANATIGQTTLVLSDATPHKTEVRKGNYLFLRIEEHIIDNFTLPNSTANMTLTNGNSTTMSTPASTTTYGLDTTTSNMGSTTTYYMNATTSNEGSTTVHYMNTTTSNTTIYYINTTTSNEGSATTYYMNTTTSSEGSTTAYSKDTTTSSETSTTSFMDLTTGGVHNGTHNGTTTAPMNKTSQSFFCVFLKTDLTDPTATFEDLVCTLPLDGGNGQSEESVCDSKSCSAVRPDPKTCFLGPDKLNTIEADSSVIYQIRSIRVPPSLLSGNVSELCLSDDYVVANVNYSYTSFTTRCMYYNEETKEFDDTGCRVGPLSVPGQTQCFVSHLTSFASTFYVPMNEIVPPGKAFSMLDENPVCFAFSIVVMCLYLVLVLWARKADLNDIKKVGVTPLPDNKPEDTYGYEITIWTGYRAGGGTTAHVSIMLTGDYDEDDPRLLEDSKRPILKRGSIDSFYLTVPRSLGKLSHLRIWHDNHGESPSWYFSRMLVEDVQTGEKFYFICDRYLAVEEDDGMIDRIIPISGRNEMTSFNHLFWSKTRRNLSDGHIWFSVFSRPIRSKFTRVQRITCCLALVFCMMTANILLYDTESQVEQPQSFQLGPMNFSFHSVYVGIMSSLITFPASLIIVTIFRMAKAPPNHKKRKPNQKKDEKVAELNVSTLDQDIQQQLILLGSCDPSDIRLNTAKPRSPSVEPRVVLTGGLEPAYPVGEPTTKKPKKKKFQLPWWFIIFGYLMSFGCVAGCFIVIVGVGAGFGKKKAEEWLASMVISLVETICFTQPIKVFLLGLFYALVIKKPDNDEDEENDHDIDLNAAELLHPTKNTTKSTRGVDRPPTYMPPDEAELENARKTRFKEIQMHAIIKEIVFYLCFLYLLLMCAYGNQDPWSYTLKRTVENEFINGVYSNYSQHGGVAMSLEKVKDRASFWQWMRGTVVPSLYTYKYYNGDEVEGGQFTADHNMYLMGVARLRQVRVLPDSCKIPRVIQSVVPYCRQEYNLAQEDTGSYMSGWRTLNESDSLQTPDVGWNFSSAIELDGYPFYGTLSLYGGGGYVAELGTSRQEADDIVDNLIKDSWIDMHTRAVFVEFVLYNAHLNLHTVSLSLVEFFAGGGVVSYPRFHIMRLDRYVGNFMLVILAVEIITALCILYLMVKEFKQLCKMKRQYFKDSWNIIEFLLMLLSIATTVMFVFRLVIAKVTLHHFRKNPTKFDNFQYTVTWDEIYGIMLALLVFGFSIKFLKLLRFNKKMSMMFMTIQKAAKNLFGFMFIFALVFFAFVQLSFLFFHKVLMNFKSFTASMETLMVMMLNRFDFRAFANADSILGPMFFLLYTVMVTFILINMFLSIIMEAFASVKTELAEQSNEYEIVDFMVDRFKRLFGIGKTKRDMLAKERALKYIGEYDTEEICDKFQGKVDEVLAKLTDYVTQEYSKSEFKMDTSSQHQYLTVPQPKHY